ncbi:MAG: hypothetical protein CO108_12080 [Deltaproteobacteria bacterium CG_4_9_14_3_um_filter_63_12]|nr:MAG: hypothetical protein CO108_12080 [Deltaproteobacteria bacterium CG_4_9_14_3_um_filter_63_12]
MTQRTETPGVYEESLEAAVIELTNRCNLRCAHCASSSGKARDDEMSTAEWLSAIGQMACLGCKDLTLIGGEVFLHPDWEHIARTTLEMGVGVSIITNGLLKSPRILERLLTLDLSLLGVSIDGASAEVYKAVRGVDGVEKAWDFALSFAATQHAPVVIITSFSRVNVGEFDAMAERVKASGLTWQVQFVHAVNDRFDASLMLSPAEHADLCRRLGDLLLASQDEPWVATMDDFGYFPLDPCHSPLHEWWRGCGAGQQVLGVRANGDVLGCLSLGDDFVAGNLKRRPLTELWRDPNTFANVRTKGNALTGFCGSCPKGELCRAGCTAMAFAASGLITENPYCLRRDETQNLLGLLGDE